MIHLLWLIPLVLAFWAIVRGGDCDPPEYDSEGNV